MSTGLDDRHRDTEGHIEEKKGNTLVGSLPRVYGHDLLRNSAQRYQALDGTRTD